MPTYEVIYFSPRGRPEPIRLALAYAGATWSDTYVGDWMARKPTTGLGQLPVLIERDGDRTWEIPQSGSILRHLARTLDLYGTTERDHTQADIACDCAVDLQAALTPLLFGPNRGKDPAALKKHFNEILPVHLARFAKVLGDGKWFAGDRPSIGDFAAFNAFDAHLAIGPSCLDAFPTLKAHYDRVAALPQLQGYLEKRGPNALRDLAPVLATGQPL